MVASEKDKTVMTKEEHAACVKQIDELKERKKYLKKEYEARVKKLDDEIRALYDGMGPPPVPGRSGR
jgi:uncharacterized protein (DUF2164 family)